MQQQMDSVERQLRSFDAALAARVGSAQAATLHQLQLLEAAVQGLEVSLGQWGGQRAQRNALWRLREEGALPWPLAFPTRGCLASPSITLNSP